MVVAKKSAGKRKVAMPKGIEPMLCTLIATPIDDPDYIYEVKFDGYRIISYVQTDDIRLGSRGGKDYTSRYPLIVEALRKIGYQVVLDGEVVVFNEDGVPDFDALQSYNGHTTPISYCLFDLLWLDGRDLMQLPLMERKAKLRDLIAGIEGLVYSESFDDGPGLYDLMIKNGIEGIVAKRKGSKYLPGNRGYDWLKVPVKIKQEFVIGAYAESDTKRAFKSLLFGAYNDEKKLEWIGRSGGGFKEREMPAILARLQQLEQKRSPFVNPILDTKGARIHYLKPTLVANFEFSGWTKSGRIRKPATFLAFREDKGPKEVIREVPQQVHRNTTSSSRKSPIPDIKPILQQRLKRGKGGVGKYLNKDSNWKKVDAEQKGATWMPFEMEQCTIQVHNIERELWEGIPKAKLLIYYNEMAPLMLPYLRDRPQSLHLKLKNAGASRDFIKDMEDRQPDCATVFTDIRRNRKEGKRDQIDYLVINNAETLIYACDLGIVDVNPWASHWQTPDHPDQLWIDLDPTSVAGKTRSNPYQSEDEGFKKAIEIARAAKEVLDKRKIKGFLKTSGKTGIHIYLPCTQIDFTQSRIIASHLCDEIHELVPDISTRNESKNARGNKVYIDAGQNDYADTLAAPYSIRPYHQPLISTPLDWKELRPSLDRWAFNMETIHARLSKKGDLFKGVLDRKLAVVNTRLLLKHYP
ncbi:DNA ligase D [Chitinophaga filiformis]|uniref:DNA ligase (ATP) n=1 Tax=Chitinophaga filiformis TaxID=104663 RepID=A0ABY4HW09_CHIFI|nr:DNA ligase D [Chitinophaga filiformis]UPK67969.1 DNA ligase D [Chitinophaga filiformis]